MTRTSASGRTLAFTSAAILSLASAAYGATYFQETFDTNPDPGVWVVDRYAPAAFESAVFDGGNRLHIGISSADSAANRPSGYSSPFYNTQGRSRVLDAPIGTTISGDVYIPSAWQSLVRRTDLWTRDSNVESSAQYPIIGFSSNDPADPVNPGAAPHPRWRVWDEQTGDWVDLPTTVTYDTWHTLSMTLTPTAFVYKIDGVVVYTDTTVSAAGFETWSRIFVQAYNFGEDYDVYWDNVTVAAAGPATLDLAYDQPCYKAGETVTVTLSMSGLGTPAAGFQAFLAYDTGRLTFNGWSYTAAPFGLPVLNTMAVVNPAPGLINLASGIDQLHGQTPSQADAALATLQFTVAGADECAAASLVTFRNTGPNPPNPPTRVTDLGGNPLLPLTTIDAPPLMIDSTPPTVTAGTIDSCYPTAVDAEAAAIAATTASDNCTPTLGLVFTAFTVGDCSAVVTVTVTDCAGNSDSVTYNTRIDNTPPVATSSGPIASCYPTQAEAEIAALANSSATDNCSTVLTPTVVTTGTCSAVITVTYADECGNVSNALTYNTRIDNTPPTITCPPNVSVNADAGTCTAYINFLSGHFVLDDSASVASVDGQWAADLTSAKSPFTYSSIVYTPATAITFNDLATLSAEYNVHTGCFGGGAPRFSVMIDMNNNGVYDAADRNVHIYWGSLPNFTDCPPAGWHATGNLIGATDARYDLLQVGGTFYDSYTTAQTLVGTKHVLFVIVAVDGGWTADQGIYIRNLTVNSDVLGFSAGLPTATDNCDPAPVITASRSDSLPLAAPFPSGTTTITWTATDSCGNVAQCTQDVTVSAYNELRVSVELSPTVAAGPITRCITFELFDCPTSAPTVVNEVLTFTNGLASNVVVLVPCGSYNCITARDKLHSLRRTDETFAIVGTQYVADFTGNPAMGGDWLIGGNLNDDYYIDILDFGVFAFQWNANYGSGNTTCATAAPHADISGNGIVFTDDFTFIQVNFLKTHEANCCGLATMEEFDDTRTDGGGARTSISVAELRSRGMASLAVADLNGDGTLDVNDIVAWMTGKRPTPATPVRPVPPRLRK